MGEPAKGDGPPWKIIIFTTMLMIGLTGSQILPNMLDHETHHRVEHIVELLTMFCLSFLMVHVGYELDLDKSRWRDYGFDYVIAMLAAGLPWILVSAWFQLAMPTALSWSSCLLIGRFAAPTSAGILFTMLEAAGLKQTWLYQKARVLAILDDLDTILLMIPLKIMMIGFQARLLADAAIVMTLLGLAWTQLHAIHLPNSWPWTMFYAAAVTAFCMFLSHATNGLIQLEVLLPAFTVGCITKMHHHEKPSMDTDLNQVHDFAREVSGGNAHDADTEEKIQTIISTVFMLLVGLSMPSLFSEQDAESSMEASQIAFHVFAVTVLMIVGKMFLVFCYTDEADFRTRLGLGLGMCPRGEVGAGVIVISLSLGISGPAVTVAVMCLAINLVLSAGFIFAVKQLAQPAKAAVPRAGRPRRTWMFLTFALVAAAAGGKYLLQAKHDAPTPVAYAALHTNAAKQDHRIRAGLRRLRKLKKFEM
mmetsp:Transcript_97641/g.173925  ORF Transcript_97641/g.173925 Transcript_97641/m.173925 type:complete len:476 (+) Transcript_97641:52-1479(+)